MSTEFDAEEIDEHATIGDIDVNVDAVKGTTAPKEHPFEFGTRAGRVVIDYDAGTRPRIEVLGLKAAHQMIGDIEHAADTAWQYQFENGIETDGETSVEHPFEAIGTRAGAVVMLYDPSRLSTPEEISVDAAYEIITEVDYAADIAAQYEREADTEEVSD